MTKLASGFGDYMAVLGRFRSASLATLLPQRNPLGSIIPAEGPTRSRWSLPTAARDGRVVCTPLRSFPPSIMVMHDDRSLRSRSRGDRLPSPPFQCIGEHDVESDRMTEADVPANSRQWTM